MKGLKGIYYATIVTIVLITVMTILAELSTNFKDFLANTFWHHWIGKGIIALAIFFLIRLLYKGEEKDVYKLTKSTVAITVLCGIAIFLFYLFHFF